MPSDAAERPDKRLRTTGNGGRLAAILVGAVLTADQLTKAWAVSRLADGPISIIGDDVDLRLSRNTGSAFSLFQGFTPLLALLAVGITCWLVRAVRRTDDRLVLCGLALVLGGALGNLADRVFRTPGLLRGGVVDFVHLGPWPTFNLADAAITIGAVTLVVAALRDVRTEHRV